MRISRNPVFSILVFFMLRINSVLVPLKHAYSHTKLSSQLPSPQVDILSCLHEYGFKGHPVSHQLGTGSHKERRLTPSTLEVS